MRKYGHMHNQYIYVSVCDTKTRAIANNTHVQTHTRDNTSSRHTHSGGDGAHVGDEGARALCTPVGGDVRGARKQVIPRGADEAVHGDGDAGEGCARLPRRHAVRHAKPRGKRVVLPRARPGGVRRVRPGLAPSHEQIRTVHAEQWTGRGRGGRLSALVSTPRAEKVSHGSSHRVEVRALGSRGGSRSPRVIPSHDVLRERVHLAAYENVSEKVNKTSTGTCDYTRLHSKVGSHVHFEVEVSGIFPPSFNGLNRRNTLRRPPTYP